MNKVQLPNRPFGPFPTVIVGAEVEEKPNYTTVGAFGCVCMKPVLYVSVKSTHYITRGIKESGFFSVNIPSTDLVQKTDYCGIVSGKTTDKSTLFTPFYDPNGRAPMISECSMNYLCRVMQITPVFDFEMVLGEIVAAYVNEQCLSEGKPDPIKINPMIMFDANYYALNHLVGNAFKTGLEYQQTT